MKGRGLLARSAVAVLAVALFYFCGSKGFGLESVPQSFEGPIADSWRKPLRQFLVELRTPDAEAALQRAKGIPVRTRKSELILVRVDSICLGNARDDCFTVIGQIVDERFVAEAMFFAGPRMNSSDARPFGATERPLVFYSKNNITGLIETSAGWIVGTSPQTEPPQ